MQSALGNNCAFIGIDADFLQQEALELLPAAGVVLELLLDAVADKTVQIAAAACATAATCWP
jgi:hypothetical protein